MFIGLNANFDSVSTFALVRSTRSNISVAFLSPFFKLFYFSDHILGDEVFPLHKDEVETIFLSKADPVSALAAYRAFLMFVEIRNYPIL